jgi:type II secretory pathway pseudopilin PulG
MKEKGNEEVSFARRSQSGPERVHAHQLLVVIDIIVILAAILFPVFARARENARRSSCQSNLKQVGLGVLQYVQDYDEKYPIRHHFGTGGTDQEKGRTGIWVNLQPYIKSEQLNQCPSETNAPPSAATMQARAELVGFTDYAYNLQLNRQSTGTSDNNPQSLSAVQDSALVVMVWERGNSRGDEMQSGTLTGTTLFARIGDLSPPSATRHLDTANYLFCTSASISCGSAQTQPMNTSQVPNSPASTQNKVRTGEVEIRHTMLLGKTQRDRLAALANSDPEAQSLWKSVKAEADALLDDTPSPVGEIFYQGIVDTEPKRVQTVKHLEDMDKLAVLQEAYAISDDAAYRDKARDYVLAWTKTFYPNGNTINENKLEPVINAYALLRDTFAAAEKTTIEAWLRRMATKEMETNGWKDRKDSPDNWDSKQYKLVGAIGFILNDRKFIDYAISSYKRYIAEGLFPDGSSHDLKKRDALSYHISGLKSLLVLAMMAEQHGVTIEGGFYDYTAPNGASMRKSVEYVVPFATGVMQREEWKNTTVGLDRERAAAGIDYYKPGKPFDPKSAVELLELASYYDPGLVRLVSILRDTTAVRYPTRLTLLTSVMR